MAGTKKSFVLYNEYIKHFEMLPKDEQADLIMLILRYVNAVEPDFAEVSGAVRMAFSFIRQRLDEDFEHYTEVCRKRSQAARAKSGKCRQLSANEGDNDNDNDLDPDPDLVTDPDLVSDPDPDLDPDPDPDLVPDPDREGGGTAACGSGTRTGSGEGSGEEEAFKERAVPTLREVEDYCRERNNGINAQKFFDYYSADGWKIGGRPVRDWKAVVRVWETRERPDSGRKCTYGALPDSGRPSYDIEEIERAARRRYQRHSEDTPG
ncbi:MAG: DUF6291 domain-containing protein [Ruminiclostridium sp.]|nr:DUF6291 domain-containing protein [Ruminiclostridium sp.]